MSRLSLKPASISPLLLFGIRLSILALCAFCTWLTVWYCSAMWYDSESQVQAPLSCVHRSLTHQLQNGAGDFWLDKLSLLGQRRAGHALFWDRDIDISAVLQQQSQKEDRPEKLFAAKLELVAQECGFVLSEHIVKSTRGSGERLTWQLTPVDQTMLRPGSMNTVGFHIRLCKQQNQGAPKSSLVCPMMHSGSPRDDDLVERSHVFPLKPCVISGADVSCPANVEQLLEDEFGKEWQDKHILEFQ